MVFTVLFEVALLLFSGVSASIVPKCARCTSAPGSLNCPRSTMPVLLQTRTGLTGLAASQPHEPDKDGQPQVDESSFSNGSSDEHATNDAVFKEAVHLRAQKDIGTFEGSLLDVNESVVGGQAGADTGNSSGGASLLDTHASTVARLANATSDGAAPLLDANVSADAHVFADNRTGGVSGTSKGETTVLTDLAVNRKSEGSSTKASAVGKAKDLAEEQSDWIFNDALGTLAAAVAAAAGFIVGTGLIAFYFLSSKACETIRSFTTPSQVKRLLLAEKEPEPHHLRDRPDFDNNAG